MKRVINSFAGFGARKEREESDENYSSLSGAERWIKGPLPGGNLLLHRNRKLAAQYLYRGRLSQEQVGNQIKI